MNNITLVVVICYSVQNQKNDLHEEGTTDPKKDTVTVDTLNNKLDQISSSVIPSSSQPTFMELVSKSKQKRGSVIKNFFK